MQSYMSQEKQATKILFYDIKYMTYYKSKENRSWMVVNMNIFVQNYMEANLWTFSM